MLFRIYIGSYLSSAERLHILEVNVQWWRYTRALYTVRPKHNGKANKNTMLSRATSREWIYARAPTRASKMTNPCTNMAATQILYLREEAVLQKTPHFKSSDCSADAICRSSWLIHHCLEKSNRTHTHIHNYCYPVVHTRWGLITGT